MTFRAFHWHPVLITKKIASIAPPLSIRGLRPPGGCGLRGGGSHRIRSHSAAGIRCSRRQPVAGPMILVLVALGMREPRPAGSTRRGRYRLYAACRGGLLIREAEGVKPGRSQVEDQLDRSAPEALQGLDAAPRDRRVGHVSHDRLARRGVKARKSCDSHAD